MTPVLYAQSGSVNLVLFSGGYTAPLGLENCGDSRLFIVQKTGQVMWSDSNGTRQTTPFLDISSRVNSADDETGLLGLAFSPKYARNGLFYVNYINKTGNTNISQFKVSANKNVADTNSEKVVLQIPQFHDAHVGGCIKFGPDGDLYIGMGDGDSSTIGDPLNYAQNKGLLQGKMLRIKVNNNGTYTIPPTNPFVDSANYRKEIWAVGLRNPWRFSFDALNGNMWIGDVGEASWEEVDAQPAKSKGGENYGWRCYEGDYIYNDSGCNAASYYTFPQYEYTHTGSPVADCAIMGGYVYRGKLYSDLYGKYFFTDFCSGNIRTLTVKGNTFTENEALNSDIYYGLTSFGEDRNNELYAVNQAGGQIFHIVSAAKLTTGKDNSIASLTVYPNPAHQSFSIRYTTGRAEECLLAVYGMDGRQIYSAKKTSVSVDNDWKIMLPSTEKGNCYVLITSMSGSIIRRNVIVR